MTRKSRKQGGFSMSGKRLTKEQKAALVADLRAGKKTFRSIAVDHNCSISTVSKLAAELGLSSQRKRCPSQSRDPFRIAGPPGRACRGKRRESQGYRGSCAQRLQESGIAGV